MISSASPARCCAPTRNVSSRMTRNAVIIVPRAAVAPAGANGKAASLEEMNAAIGRHIKRAAQKAAVEAKQKDQRALAHCIAAAAALAASGKLVLAGAKKRAAAAKAGAAK